jgi:twinkle protein
MAFIKTHLPCDECGSSDALSLNADGSTHCFSCGKHTPANNVSTSPPQTTAAPSLFVTDGDFQEISSRGLWKDTCKKFGYRVGKRKGEWVHIADYRDLEGKLEAQKLRYDNKKFEAIGTPRSFFGMHLWPMGGKKLVVTEGEIDALSVSQAQDNKWAVVSLPNGAQSAQSVFKRHLNWLNRWDEVILMFDEDEQGRKAIDQVANILPVGRAKVARLPHKDPNECLLNNATSAIITAIFQANIWRPDDILDGRDVLDRLLNPKPNQSVSYPFVGLNEMTRGLRKREIVTFCAGSGVGKSQVCRVIAHHLLTNVGSTVGYLALEESVERTAQGIVGLELKQPIHLEPFDDEEEFRKAFETTVGSGRCYLYDHWGSMDGDNLLTHIRYMAQALDVEWVILDHLSIVVSGLDSSSGDERRMIDNTMTRLRSLAEECEIGLIVVSHLKRPEGRGHEEGVATSLSALRGSTAIAGLSDMVIGVERNLQDPEKCHVTALRVLKNRFSGETGIACHLKYEKDTGLMHEFQFDEETFEPFDPVSQNNEHNEQ